MEKKRRRTLIGVVTAALLVIAVVIGWQVHQRRVEQVFIAEQYAQLERDKVAIEEEAPPEFDERAALGECEDHWRASDDARRFRETHSVTARPSTQVSEDLHTVSGTVSGTNGQKDIEANFSCSALLDGTDWEIKLL